MSRIAFLIIFLAFGSCLAGEPLFRADRILVKLKPGNAVAALGANERAVRSFAGLKNIRVLDLQPGSDVKVAVKKAKATGLVEYAEPDYIVSIIDSPNDPQYQDGTLWGLHNTGQSGGVNDADIDAPEAWNIQHSSPNIIVAVIDTGIRYTHQDLASNMWVNPTEIAGNAVDDDGNGYVDDVHGINAITNSGNPMDDHGHGSHCAGTIGAAGNNSLGIVGVTRSVRLMACKFLDASGFGSTTDAIECIDYARAKGAHIMSNSWGGGGFSQALQDAIDQAAGSGIIFVAAAGNASTNNDVSPNYPSNYPSTNIVAVASTTRTDSLSSFSNYGAATVDIGAPGSDIYSCVHNSDSSYGFKSGTSMATPHVAGACALLAARFPGLTHQQLIQRLLENVDPIPALAGRCVSNGRLNLHKALFSDAIPPTVTLNQAVSQKDPTRSRPIRFEVVFSEPVQGFTSSDLTIQGVAPASVAISGSDAAYVVEIDPGAATNGTLTVSLPAGTVQDLGGNANEASASTDNSVTFSPADTLYWQGQSIASNLWSDGDNWSTGNPPLEGDVLIFSSPGQQNNSENDFPVGTEFGSITFQDGGFNLIGNEIRVRGTIANQADANTIDLPLNFGVSTSIQSNNGALTFGAASSLDLNGYTVSLEALPAGSIILGAPVTGDGTLELYGAGVLNVEGTISHTGLTRIASGTVNLLATNVLSSNAELQVDAILDISGGDQAVGLVSGSGHIQSSSMRYFTFGTNDDWQLNTTFDSTISLIKTGAGRTEIVSLASYSGFIRINQGSLAPQHSSSFGSPSSIEVLSGGSLVLSDGYMDSGTQLTLDGNGAGNSGALQFGNASVWNGPLGLSGPASVNVPTSIATLSGGIVGSFPLTKVGSGGLELTGTHPYAGPFVVEAGLLQMNGDFSNAPVQLSSAAATLGGVGSCGSISSSSGTVFSPGESDGYLIVNGLLSLTAGASLALHVDSTNSGVHGKLVVNGSVTLGGSLKLTRSGVAPAAGTPSVIVQNDGADPVSGTFAGMPEGSARTASGIKYQISYVGGDGNDVVLTAIGPASGLYDDFDPGIDLPQWAVITGASNTNFAPSAPAATGNSAFFDGESNVVREARTIPLDVSGGGTIQFSLIYGSGSFPENADPGEEVVLEYSVNNGVAYTQIAMYSTDTYVTWTSFSLPVPVAAQTATTIFRWRQIANSGLNFDHWALDNVLIGSGSPPSISDISNQSTVEDSLVGPVAFTVGDTDTPLNTLSLTAASTNPTLVPSGNILFGGSGASRTFTITPAPNQAGSATITINVSDGTYTVSDSFVLTVTDDNTPPTISPITGFSMIEDSTSAAVNFTIGDTQTPVANLALSASSSSSALFPVSGITFGGSGANRTLTVTPGANQTGSGTITITVADNGAPDTAPYTASTTFNVTVTDDNTAPTISTIAAQTLTEDTTSSPIPFVVNDTQSPAATLTLSASTTNGALLPVSGIKFGGSGSNRTLTITPGLNVFGSGTVTITVRDDGAPDSTPYAASTSFAVTVVDDNTAPVISAISNQTLIEDSTSAPIAFYVADLETLPANLSVTAGTSNSTLLPLSGLTLNGNGSNRTLTIRPGGNQTGSATVTLFVQDDGAPDTVSASAQISFSVTVVDDNAAPTISAIPAQTGYANRTVGPIPFYIGDVETPVANLNVTASSSNTALIPNSSIQIFGTGAVRGIQLQPAANQVGNTTISVQVQDSGAPDGLARTTTVTFAVNVLLDSSTGGQSFKILSLGTSGARVISADSIVGDDRGGLAVSDNQVFLTGDNATGRFLQSDLSGGTSLGIVRDGLVCNVKTGTVYLLANGATPIGYGGTVSTLLGLNSATGVPDGSTITLSQSITMSGGSSGVFSGYDRIVLYNGSRVYSISLPSGAVTDLGIFTLGSRNFSESWAFWGIAEYFGGSVYLVYVNQSSAIVRQRVPDGTISTIQAFTSLGDMASISFSTLYNRWYFHYESSSQFGSFSEALGYADATWEAPIGSAPVISQLPNATITEDTVLGPLGFGVNDVESPGSLTVTGASSNTTLIPNQNIVITGSGSSRSVSITPAANAFGSATITLTVNDGQNLTSTSFTVTVADDNTAPTLALQSSLSVNLAGGPVTIPITISDAQSASVSLTVTAESGNQFVLPAGNIVLGGNGGLRTLTITPGNTTGKVVVSVKVQDTGAPDADSYSNTLSTIVTLHRGAAYVRSTLGEPFNSTANAAAMDRVFGAGGWNDLRYETVSVSQLFSAEHRFIFLEGGEFTAIEMEMFINGNRAAVEQWVSAGGTLFVNSAASEGNGLLAPFNVSFTAGTAITTANPVTPSHSIFAGPFAPALTSTYSGTVARGNISGTGLTSLLTNNATSVLLAEKAAGAGHVVYGTMTPDNLQSPAPQCANLRANILAYTASRYHWLSVSGYPHPVPPGVERSFKVTARNFFGELNPEFTGTVRFFSSDANAILPGNYQFTPADQGEKLFTAAFRTSGTVSLSAAETIAGAFPGTQSGIVISPNSLPVISNLLVSAGIKEGGKAVVTGQVDEADIGQSLTLTVDWGNGDTATLLLESGSSVFEFEHTCIDNGNYTVVVKAEDSVGGEVSQSAAYTVQNLPPKPAIIHGGSTLAIQGQLIQLTSTIQDPGAIDTHTLSWIVQFNGSTIAAGGGPAFAFTTAQIGLYEIQLTATDKDGAIGTTTLSIECNGAPQFTSDPTATPNPAKPNTPVRFQCVVPDTDIATIVWDFGDGTQDTTNNLSPIHVFTPAGLYTVSVTVTDTLGLATTKNLALTIDPAGGAAVPGGFEPDSDGDGFSDSMEIVAGTSPFSINSTPLGGAPAGEPLPILNLKSTMKLNFAKPGKDSVSASGILTAGEDFSPNGQRVMIEFGGVVQAFLLDSKAKSKTAEGTFALKFKPGAPGFQAVKFAWKSKGTFADALEDEGLLNGDVFKENVQINITVLFGNRMFMTTQRLRYSAKKGKSGSAK